MEEMQGIVGNNPCPAVVRLEFEHFESDRHGWRKCERIPALQSCALNSNILNLTAMDGGNAKGLQEQSSPSSFHPELIRGSLNLRFIK
jgi:hypothetical protein